MKAYVGGKKIYAVNLTSGGGIAAEVLVINTATQPVPVQIVGGMQVNLNLPNPLPVSVQNPITVASVQSPVMVQGSVSVTNTVNTLVTNTNLAVVNAPNTHLSVQFPSAQPVTVQNTPLPVTFMLPIQSRVYNRLAGANPDYNELFVNVTSMPPVSFASNQTVNVAQPIKVMNADAPNQHLSVNINSPLLSGRVRVIHETVLDTLVTNSAANPVQTRIAAVDPSAEIGVKNTVSNRLHTSSRIAEVAPATAFYAYNRVLQGGNVVDPTDHSGANKKFLETRIDSAPERPVHVQFVGDPIQVEIDDLELEADLFDYRLAVKQSGAERIHWGRHDRSTGGGPFGYTVPFTIRIERPWTEYTDDPNARWLYRFYFDTRHTQQTGVAPEEGYVQIGNDRLYAPSLNMFRRFALQLWAMITPTQAGFADPWTGIRDFSSVLGAPSDPSRPRPVMYWGHNLVPDMGSVYHYYDHTYVLRAFQRRGGERIPCSVYRVEPATPYTQTEATASYNWGAYPGAEREMDRLSPNDHVLGIQTYGKLLARCVIGLDRAAPHTVTGAAFPVAPQVYYGRVETRFEGPASLFVFEFDLQAFRETFMLGPVLRYGSSYIGNPARRYLNHLAPNMQLIIGGVIHGLHSS